MSNGHFQINFAVCLILERDGKIWLQRRAHTGYRDGYYDVASGHVDGNETARTAAIREGAEEAGVTVLPEDLEFVHVRHNKDSVDALEYINIFFRTTRWSGEPDNIEKDRSDLSGWYALAGLPDPIVPHLVCALDAMKKGSSYSDWEMNQ